MTGATSPRLHLELLCARILLPSSEQTERGIAARIDRVERRLNYAGNDVGTPAVAASAPACPCRLPSPPRPCPPLCTGGRPARRARSGSRTRRPRRRARPGTAHGAAGQHERLARGRTRRRSRVPAGPAPLGPGARPGTGGTAGTCGPGGTVAPAAARTGTGRPGATPDRRAAAAPRRRAGPGADVEVLRRAWPEILQTLTKIKRSTWALVEPNAQVGHFEDQVLTLAFTTPGLAGAFGRADHAENLRQAIHKTIGIDCQINAVAGGANSAASSEPNPKAPASRDAPATSADAAWGLTPGSAAVHAGGWPSCRPPRPRRPPCQAPAALQHLLP